MGNCGSTSKLRTKINVQDIHKNQEKQDHEKYIYNKKETNNYPEPNTLNLYLYKDSRDSFPVNTQLNKKEKNLPSNRSKKSNKRCASGDESLLCNANMINKDYNDDFILNINERSIISGIDAIDKSELILPQFPSIYNNNGEIDESLQLGLMLSMNPFLGEEKQEYIFNWVCQEKERGLYFWKLKSKEHIKGKYHLIP